MVGLAALAEFGLFQFDKVAYVRIRSQFRAWTQSCVWTDFDVFSRSGLFQVAECLYLRAGAQLHIAQNAMRPDTHAICQGNVAFKDAAHVNKYIAPAF